MADLEAPDSAPSAAADPTPPPVPDPPAAPADPIEASAVEMQGGKYVPLSALHEARAIAKELKDKAQRYDEVSQYVAISQPYIEFLKANPNFMQARQDPAPAAQPAPVDEAAEMLAKTLDLYTPDGKPDVKRAQTVNSMIRAAAQAEAAAKVAPLEQSTTRERAGHMYQRALATKAPDGRVPDKAVLDAIWTKTDPNILATEEGATAAVMLALGMGSFTGQVAPPQAPQTAPVVSERPGGRAPNLAPMNGLEERIAGIRNVKAEDWSKLTRSFNPGRTNVLED